MVQTAKDYGSDHPATDVRATVSGEMDRVSYKVTGLPKFDQQGQPWTVEGGAWKYDVCSPRSSPRAPSTSADGRSGARR
ncbi:hypothetical protein [Streptomyces pseudovenezuelae]|uniref:hypothetical protein n=1 Tax=Streptomyces pseudovenezuelae TaxID=67350 RepID=UPI0036EC629B